MSVVPRLRVPSQGQWSPLCGRVGRPREQVLVRGPSVALGLVGKEKAILLCSKDPKTSEVMGGHGNGGICREQLGGQSWLGLRWRKKG